MPTPWVDYIDAAHRKIAIVSFHRGQLKAVLAEYGGSFDALPTIPIQAHFEGTIVATVSAIDQVAQAVNSALGLGLGSDRLFEGASAEIETMIPRFREWREQPIGLDLRRLRVRMVHYSYDKSPNGELQWVVEPANEGYAGPRDLASYADAAVAYGGELGVIADELERKLAVRDKELKELNGGTD